MTTELHGDEFSIILEHLAFPVDRDLRARFLSGASPLGTWYPSVGKALQRLVCAGLAEARPDIDGAYSAQLTPEGAGRPEVLEALWAGGRDD